MAEYNPIGKPILPRKPDYSYTSPVDRRPLREREAVEIVEKIKDALILYRYSLSPWTRDVGQKIAHKDELYPLLKGFMPTEIEKRIEELIGEEINDS